MKDENTKNDDVTIETDADLDDSVVAEESAQETIKNLREKLKKAITEKQEYLDGWQRAKADFVNTQKRNSEMLKESISFANEGLIEELLPTLQSFEIAFANKEAWEKVDKNWRVGVEFIYSKLKSTLEANGLKEMNPLNQPFNPMEHEAIRYEKVSDESKKDKVIEVVEKGYMLGNKNLRPPKVVVGEFTKE